MDDSDIQLAEILWNYHRISDKPVKLDVIIGLGSYDTRVAGHCARLLSEGWAPLIIFTGAEGNFTRGKWEKTEAETFADVAIAAGVNPDKILAETLATNTGENARFTRELIENQGLKIQSAIVASKPNMNRRALATFQLHWPELKITCSSPDTHFNESPAPGHTPEDVVSEIVGDIQRIIEYPAMGYQTEQEIPTEVMDAYEQLRQRGFTGHLM